MSTASLPGPARAWSRASRLQRAIHTLRTEGDSRGREAIAIGVGIFIGCSPLWGFHLGMCWLVGLVARLNRLKMYLAANVINPLIIPALLYAEVQAGALTRRGHMLEISWDMVSREHIWSFGIDLVVGSVIIGLAVGGAGAWLTWMSRRPASDPFFQGMVRGAADHYLDAGITAWEFARGKLSGDPVYAAALSQYLAGATGTLIDIGCGQGLMLALIAEAQRTASSGQWEEGRPAPPRFQRLIGVETRPRVAAIAARALEHEATIVSGDAREQPLEAHDVALLFDVLHMMPDADQRALLRAIHATMVSGGRLLVREADAAAGWRFTMVRFGNRLKALLGGNWGQAFSFRTAAEWRRLLEEEGFIPEVMPMGEGTPFANVLISAARAS